MIFFYNFQTYHHKTVQLTEHTCPKCKNRGVMKMIFNQFYTKSIFISTLPFRKFAVLYCDSCKYEIPINRWEEDLKQLRNQELKTLKTPKELKKGFSRLAFLLFAPIIIGALLILYQVNFASKSRSNSSKENLKTVQVNDVFFVSLSGTDNSNSYGLIKIIATDAEKTIILVNKKYYQNITDGNSIDLSDVDNSQFEATKIIVETSNLVKYQGLIEPNKQQREAMFGRVHYKIEN